MLCTGRTRVHVQSNRIDAAGCVPPRSPGGFVRRVTGRGARAAAAARRSPPRTQRVPDVTV
eukprot:COSAG05_NODE_6398_length_967_cov_0.647465_1_plen_60_part_10